jgi:hypothetical protein
VECSRNSEHAAHRPSCRRNRRRRSALSGGGLRRRLQPGTTIGGKAYPGSVRMLDPSNGKVQSTPNTVYLIKAANGHILNVLNKNRFDFAQPELADGHLYPTNLVAIGEYGPWPPPPAPGAWRRVRLRSARISARSYRRRAPPPRGPRPGLSVERIVAAAVRVAGSRGPGGSVHEAGRRRARHRADVAVLACGRAS